MKPVSLRRLWDALSVKPSSRNVLLVNGTVIHKANGDRALADALQRCHAIDDLGLTWIEEPIVYDNFDGFAQLAAELKTLHPDR